MKSTAAKAKSRARAGAPVTRRPVNSDLLVRAWMVALFALTPFIVSASGFEKFRLPKDVFFAIVVSALVASFLLTRKLRSLTTWRWFGWESLLVLGLVYVFVQGLLLGRMDTAWEAGIWLTLAAAALFVISHAATQSFQINLWLVFSTSCAANAFLSILEHFGAFPLFTRITGAAQFGRETPAGLIGEVNSGGFLFGLCSLMLLYHVTAGNRTGVRVLAAILLAMNLAGLLMTQTISAIGAFVVALFCWVALYLWWTVKTYRRAARAVTAIILVLALALTSAALVLKYTNAGRRVDVLIRSVAKGNLMVATSGRYPVFVITWSMIKERPWFGRGLDTFGNDFFHYRANTEASQLPMIDQPGAFRETHNDPLQIWEELGVTGLALFVGLLLIAVVSAFRSAWRTSEPKTLYFWGQLTVGMIFVAVASLGLFPFRLSVTSLGIILLIAGLRRVAWNDSVGAAEPIRGGRGWRLGLGAALVLCIAYPAIQLWRANSKAGVATAVLDAATTSRLNRWQRRVYAETALTELRSAEAMWPRLSAVYNLKGSASMLLGQYGEAARDYRRAAEAAPSPEVVTNLAVALMAIGEHDEAARLLEAALRYNPSYAKAAQALQHLKTVQTQSNADRP